MPDRIVFFVVMSVEYRFSISLKVRPSAISQRASILSSIAIAPPCSVFKIALPATIPALTPIGFR
jgi:hypothetical protein